MRRLTLTICLLAAAIALTACGPSPPSSGPRDTSPDEGGELAAVEIREYEGADLSSIEAFRENSIKGPQYVDQSSYSLTIDGLVRSPVEHSYSEVTSGYPAYRKVVRLDCVEGWGVEILWEGVLVRDLLDDTDVLPAANTVILHAVDGYTTSFPLAYFYEKDILLAYRMNGVTLPPERGYPFQLVAEDKWGYKWIRWVERIELSDDPEYRGYWESRGYSNTGDRDASSFGE